MKKASFLATSTAVLLVTAVFSGFEISDDGSVFAEGSGDYPPPLTGDWIIGNATVVSNETLLVSGNVTILPGGSLTLSNTTLLINCSQNGTFHIEVESFGTLSLLDDSNITSAIEDGTHNYEFWVSPDANLTVSHSSIGYVGWNGADYRKMGISIQSNNVSISDSWIHHNFLGILLYNASGPVYLTNNSFTDMLHDALYAESTEVVLRENSVSNCGHGFLLGLQNGGIVESNTFSSNDGYGIYLAQSENLTVTRNELTSNAWGGLFLIDSVSNIISENDLDGNLDGIALWQSNMNVITNNRVANNFNGIWILGSSQNRIFHNRILWNSAQAFDDSVNNWDDGYPSGGNYWSDYGGSDVYSGENQDLPGRDGIGDIPYFLLMTAMDMYPLMVDNRSLFPQPPENITASLEGKDHENVTVSWNLSRDEAYGSIVGYDVYRGTLYNPSGSDYLLVDSLANGSSSWADIGSGEGDANDYFYVVCALSNSSLSSCTSDQAAKFTRSLTPGPNLVSIPLIQSNESIETVLQTVGYDKAWYYDSFSQEWKWFMTYKDYRRGLWSVNHTKGLWVNVTSDCNLTVAGIVPAQTTIHLQRGWNLVSFPSFNSSYTAYDFKMDTGAVRVEGYEPTLPYHLRVLGDGEVLQAGYGYWVRVGADAVWTVDMS